jgi:hypothetical protein
MFSISAPVAALFLVEPRKLLESVFDVLLAGLTNRDFLDQPAVFEEGLDISGYLACGQEFLSFVAEVYGYPEKAFRNVGTH